MLKETTLSGIPALMLAVLCSSAGKMFPWTPLASPKLSTYVLELLAYRTGSLHCCYASMVCKRHSCANYLLLGYIQDWYINCSLQMAHSSL